MHKADTERESPHRSRCIEPNTRSKKTANRDVAEVDIAALPRKELKRRLRHYEKLGHE
jgi:hypothetical protein